MEPLALLLVFGSLGTTEILLIVFVILLLFGARKIPELAKGLGKGIGEFKRGMREGGTDGERPSSAEAPRDPSHREPPRG